MLIKKISVVKQIAKRRLRLILKPVERHNDIAQISVYQIHVHKLIILPCTNFIYIFLDVTLN